jgi:cytochrome oxidase assembly protein ShyY1
MIAFRRPSLFAWLLLAAALASFVAAGRWQYGKADAKRERLARWLEVAQAPWSAMTGALARDDSGFDRVRTDGKFLSQIYLLDNQVRDGRAGVEAFAPLRTGDGALVLIALGWLQYSGPERRPPALPTISTETVEVEGVLAPPPAHGIRMGRDWSESPGYPKLMPYFSLDEIAADVGEGPLAARVLRLAPEPGAPYLRDWRPVDGMPPARHLAYAWQWWSLAVAAVIVFVVVHRRRGGSA